MKQLYIMGEKLFLRALEKSDINDNYLMWINDPEVTKYMVTGSFPSNMEMLEEYYINMTKSTNHVILAIVDIETVKHVGNITLNNINWITRKAILGLMIGEKQFWGKGYGSEATNLVVRYAFDQLNLRRLWLGCYANHKSAIRVYEKAGFIIEGELKDEYYSDGKFHNMLIMGITRESV